MRVGAGLVVVGVVAVGGYMLLHPAGGSGVSSSFEASASLMASQMSGAGYGCIQGTTSTVSTGWRDEASQISCQVRDLSGQVVNVTYATFTSSTGGSGAAKGIKKFPQTASYTAIYGKNWLAITDEESVGGAVFRKLGGREQT